MKFVIKVSVFEWSFWDKKANSAEERKHKKTETHGT